MTEEPGTPRPAAGGPGGVWDYVRRRNQLDEEILTKFARPVTIMFTDICGSTTFFDMRGDVEGVTMLQRHNEVVYPAIEQAGGRVLQRLGDGLLVTFPTPAPAVRAAIEIQKRLAEFNAQHPDRDEIHVRVGINTGLGLVEEQNVFGDAVNVAARVETLAEPDQILVSESAYSEAVAELGADLFLPIGPSTLKGKLEKVVVFEVAWSPERARLRTATRGGAALEVFHLEVSRIAGRLKVTGYARRGADEQTLRSAEECAYDEREVGDAAARIDTLLAAADPQGRITKAQLEDLVGLGRFLHERLVPPETRARLAATTSVELLLRLDEQLVQLPWELLHDGQEFLCLRFAVGRVVSTSRALASTPPRELRAPLRIALVAAATQDLPAAAGESSRLSARLTRRPEFEVSLTGHEVGRDEFLRQFARCDILHFAGHTDYDGSQPAGSGLRLADGRLSAADLDRLGERTAVPRVVFVNGCESARAPEWRGPDIAAVFGLANAFLLTGVKHYVGTLRSLEDRAAFQFAAEFYDALGGGQSIGLAVREARRRMAKAEGRTSLTWASYALYGDPTSRYLPPEPSPARPHGVLPWRLLAIAGSIGVVIALFLVWLLYGGQSRTQIDVAYGHLAAGRLPEAAAEFGAQIKKNPARASEGLALVAVRQNDLARAEQLCVEALRLDPGRSGCLLVQGDLHLARSDTKRAASAYEGVIALAGVPAAERATAFNRLGRVAAEEGQLDRAAAGYAKARETDPGDWESLSNLGALLRRQGRHAEAVGPLEEAAALRPGDPLIQTLLKAARDATTSARDQDRDKRVDALIGELVQRYRSGDVVRPPAGGDEWTSRQLTLSFLGIESKGRIPLREGEHDFLQARLGEVLAAEGRVRLVERAILDKLLDELRLSSSVLADRGTALKLGRLLSARLIAVGSMTSSASEWQLTIRVVETETSTMVASIARSMPLTQAPGPGAEALGKELAAKLRQAYPLRARVIGVDARGVILNVGTAQGAAPGQRLRVFREGPQGMSEVAGEIEIIEVESGRSRAKSLGPPNAIVSGLRAREI